MNRNCFVSFLILSFFPCLFYSQQRYSIEGTYKKQSAQSMAIWGDTAYLFYNSGICRALNLKTGQIVCVFKIASSGKNTHVNSASFGSEIAGYNGRPVIYLSETRKPYRCFVEQLDGTSSYIVQTLYPRYNGHPKKVTSWIVDANKKALYALSRVNSRKQKESDKIEITKYRLPNLLEGDSVLLSEKDVVDSFYVYFRSALQDGVIIGDRMYISSGFHAESLRKFFSPRAVQVVDLKLKTIIRRIDLSSIFTNEPEGIDFWGGKMLLFTGQAGGIYEVNVD